MRRRDFLSGIAASSMVGSGVSLRSARAQQAGRIYHVGAISFLSRETPHYVAFFDELRKAGFIENKNMKVDLRGFDLRGEKVAQVAAALVEDKVDILITGGDALIRAAQKATRTIPILAVTDDMVSTGLVRSLSNPGGNITGVSIFAPELDRKRLDLLFELIPAARRIALLLDSGTTAPAQIDALKKIAASRGVELTAFAVSTPDEIRAAVLAAKAANAAALNGLGSARF